MDLQQFGKPGNQHHHSVFPAGRGRSQHRHYGQWIHVYSRLDHRRFRHQRRSRAECICAVAESPAGKCPDLPQRRSLEPRCEHHRWFSTRHSDGRLSDNGSCLRTTARSLPDFGQTHCTASNGAYPGAIVSLYGTNLAAGSAVPVITIGGQPVTVLFASPTQLNLQLPSGLAPGPAILTMNNGIAPAFPITVNIDTLPAGISAVQSSSGAYISATNPAQQGELLIVTLSNFAPPGTSIDPSRVQVSVSGDLPFRHPDRAKPERCIRSVSN